jgi:hypothetical protein
MNQFEFLCANLHRSDSHCFAMTQNFVSQSQSKAVLFKMIQSSSDKSRTRQCESTDVRGGRVASRATFWGAKPITGDEMSGATEAH